MSSSPDRHSIRVCFLVSNMLLAQKKLASSTVTLHPSSFSACTSVPLVAERFSARVRGERRRVPRVPRQRHLAAAREARDCWKTPRGSLPSCKMKKKKS